MAGPAVIEQYYGALNRRDWSAYPEVFTADAALEGPGGVTGSGPAAMQEFDSGFARAVSDFHLRALTVCVSGDRVAYELRATGTHDGPFATPQGDIPASGNQIDVKGVGVFELRDGRISAQRVYFDRLQLIEQLTGSLVGAE